MRTILEAGGKGDKIVMGHLDRTIEQDKDILEFADNFGCYLEYDLFGIESSYYQMDETFFMPNDGIRIKKLKVPNYTVKPQSSTF